MEPNPYQAPAKSNAPAVPRGGDKRIFKAGIRLAVGAFALPILGFAIGRAYVEFASLGDPVPQGAMVVAFLAFMASLAVAVFLFTVGIGMAWLNRRS